MSVGLRAAWPVEGMAFAVRRVAHRHCRVTILIRRGPGVQVGDKFVLLHTYATVRFS